MSILAFLFVLIDWLEHKLTLGVLYNPKAVRLKIYWNITYWMRFFGVLSFVIGFLCFVSALIFMEYNLRLDWSGLKNYLSILLAQWPTSLHWALGSSFMGVLLLPLFRKWYPQACSDQVSKETAYLKPIWIDKPKQSFWIELLKQSGTWLLGLIPFFLGATIVIYLISYYYESIPMSESISRQTNGFLLMLILLPTLGILFRWVSKPMGRDKANIGNILILQFATSKTKVEEVFHRWLDPFVRIWDSAEDDRLLYFHGIDPADLTDKMEKRKAIAWIHLRQVLRISIWRDIIGFVPLYSICLGLPLWMASILWCADSNDPPILGCCPWWLGLIFFTAMCDMIENLIHLIHIKHYPSGKINNMAVGIGNFFTFLKFLGFTIQFLLSLAVFAYLLYGTLIFADGATGMFANFIIILSILGLIIFIVYKIDQKIKSILTF